MSNPLARTFRSLRHFNYRLWAVGALVSNIGSWVQRTAQSWLVFTQLTEHSASALGIVLALQFAPQLLLLPWTGYAADHFNQRRLLMLTQAAMGALSLALGLLTILDIVQLWHVYVLALLFGCAAAVDAPVRQTFVAELVGDEDLPNAVALNSTSFNAAQMIGPAIAGGVIATVGTGWAFLIDGFSFAAVLISLFLLRRAQLKPIARTGGAKGNFVEGIRYVMARPDLKAILLMLFLIGTFGLNFPIFISGMAVGVFHADAASYGLLSTIMAIGTISGSLLTASRKKAARFGVLLVGVGAFGLGCALAALAPGYWSFAAALILIGVAAFTFTNTTNSLMQLSTEPKMRGRVMALRVGVALGGTPIGALIEGRVADQWGPRWALGVAATAAAIAVLVCLQAMRRQIDSHGAEPRRRNVT
ncbi:MFS transporter [Rhizobium sp. BK376]|uniref:MFS transporter n=1 Tax=Rhizobium sp. BK376 TaxID=2512149 RepID=UPI00104DBA0B|nr:MFS transporter [Rhizobium sp. BK376]TCR78721.1 putative MFS family arabinose efflux permease [Rhizobium sp. BK376]